MQENFDLGMTIAVSHKVQGLHKIRQAYNWVRDALAARQPGAQEVLVYWKQVKPQPTLDKSSEKVEAAVRRLAQLAAAGDTEGAMNELKALKKAAALLPGWSVRMQFTVLLQELLQNLTLRFSADEVAAVAQRVQQYMEAPPSKDDFAEMNHIIKEACALSSAAGENVRRADVARKADQYIQENYMKSSMSISSVAEYLNLTASYASALYKRQTGQAMLDAINLTRIHHAKLLLTGSHMSLEQVAQQVGYFNSSSFIRTFKKYEGVTPGQFRSLNGNTGAQSSV